MSRKIKKMIDQVIGDDELFTDKDRTSIYSKIKQHNQQNKIHHASKLKLVFAYSFVAALLFIFSSIGFHEFNKNQHHTGEQDQDQTQPTDQLAKENTSFEYNEELAEQYPDQFQIVKKMHDSWDQIENAQGVFEWGNPKKKDKIHVTFNVDFNKKKNRVTRNMYKDGEVIEQENILVKDSEVTFELQEKGLYTTRSLKTDSNRLSNYLRLFNERIFHTEWISELKDNYGNWSYKEDVTFGMPVYNIEGTDQLNRPFIMTVTKDTGIILDLKLYDQDHEVIFYITVKEIQVNEGIQHPESIFKLDISGDQKVSFDEYNSNTVGSKAFKGEKTGWDHVN